MSNINALLSLPRGELRVLGRSLQSGLAVVAEAAPETAYVLKALYKEWDSRENIEKAGVVRLDPADGYLYASNGPIQGNGDPNWAPHLAVSSWTKIADPSQTGTRDNPIAWSPGMVLHEGLYYTEDGVLYICIRDEGPNYAMHVALANLVHNYVEVVAA